MRVAEDLFQELQALDESHRIEAKRASQIDRSILETVVAFANEPGLCGGYLLLGVERDPTDMFGAYRIVGVDDPDKLQADLASQCASALNRPVRPRISAERLQGKTVLAVHVPESAPAEKPIYLTRLGLPRGAFRRIGSTDQEGSEDDLIALYAGQQMEAFDSAVLPDTDMSDIDPLAVQDYRRQREKAKPSAEELTWEDDSLLRALGAAKRQGGELKPTVAGLLLFGTTQALRRCFPMMRIDYIRVPGRRWVEDPDHRFDTLEIRAPLLTAIRRAENAVRDELMQSFSLPEGSLAREDNPALPLRVIREAIVNAAMHRSYRLPGAIQIIRYANRLEIHNPGHSIKAEDQLGEPGSAPRNQCIATILHEVNVAETKGSGIGTMRRLMQQHDLQPPTFESSRRPDHFVATFLFHHFLDAADLAWLRALTPESLSNDDSRALVFVREKGAIDNATYRSFNRTDTLTASAHLRRLRDLDLLVMRGSGSRTHYVPGPAFTRPASATGPGASPASPQPGADTHMADAQTHMVEADTHMVEAQTHMAGPLLGAIPPEELRRRLPAPGTRPGLAAIRQLVWELCSWKPLSARELTALLGRQDINHLVRQILSPMVSAGQLRYTIPTMDKHPDQRYAAAGHLLTDTP